MSTRLSARLEWCTPKACAVMPPSDRPTMWALSTPSASRRPEVVGEVVDRDRFIVHLRAAVSAGVVEQATVAVRQRRDLTVRHLDRGADRVGERHHGRTLRAGEVVEQ